MGGTHRPTIGRITFNNSNPSRPESPKGGYMVVREDPHRAQFDIMIGRLDRILAEFLDSLKPTLDESDRQTLKHHADDLIGVGQAMLKRLKETPTPVLNLNLDLRFANDPTLTKAQVASKIHQTILNAQRRG